MRSKLNVSVVLCVVTGVLSLATVTAQVARSAPRFVSDDPLMVDDDTVADASEMKEVELSEGFDLIENQFGSPGDATPRHAINVNTLDEVPDSSWFTNRIGVRALPMPELLRGANTFDPAESREWREWTIVSGKGHTGFQPGFRAERAGEPGREYQLEVDPKGHPRLATGAEFIGALIYHALGYNVEDFYLVKVHPRDLKISDKATIKDPSGKRRFTKHDLDNILRVAATDGEGNVYFSAQRRSDDDLGHFQYHGTRSDDPNDIYPHEHRRELRANRVIAAWLAHDDSRALNTRNLLIKADGQSYVRHYMHDFGAILGSSTRFPEPPISNHEYYIEKKASLRQLVTLGLFTPRALRADGPEDIPPSVGWFESGSFDPVHWKANYPNRAFMNMQPADAFWGARLVSRFSDEAIHAIVASAGYDDPEAVGYLARTLIRRRDHIARVWLNGVNPVVEPLLSATGALSFTNAAVAARVASHGTYTIEWGRFDNATGQIETMGTQTVQQPGGDAPAALLTADYVVATISSAHPDQPNWSQPVRVYFKRQAGAWKTVGLRRHAATAARLK